MRTVNNKPSVRLYLFFIIVILMVLAFLLSNRPVMADDDPDEDDEQRNELIIKAFVHAELGGVFSCLLYTSDAADE